MKESRKLVITGTLLEKRQLENHLEKIASSHNIMLKSEKETYPVPQLQINFKIIEEVYKLLNDHVKIGINISPAGEWLLDNFYIIEESVKQIEKDLPLKKYVNFVGIANGEYRGFARIYVLASEIVAYTDNKIERDNLEDYLRSYQKNKTLSMDEIWNIGIFLQIAIIQNIAEICKKIYCSQLQKFKAESIAERLIENNEKSSLGLKKIYENSNLNLKNNYLIAKLEKGEFNDTKYSFIEYMSFLLKKYGKKGNSYLNALEEVTEKLGTTVSDIIKKEHFEIALQKVSMGNSITSIKEIQRVNFLEIFEKINGVEEILKQDPAGVYIKMDYKTKDYYRGKIKEISKKTKYSEIYIAKKILELAENSNQKKTNNNIEKVKSSHIGYYLIDDGINILYDYLGYHQNKKMSNNQKSKIYVSSVGILSALLSAVFSYIMYEKTHNIAVLILTFIFFLVPSSEVVVQILQYFLSKFVKPKLIPKIDFSNGIDKENSCFVVIPTIVKDKEKVNKMFKNLEKYYLANKSSNIYFALLGDCSESDVKDEDFDEEVVQAGKECVEKLNKKYKNEGLPIFNFIYRERVWNEKENSYLGWERKRGMLNQFNEYILYGKNPFKINTIEEYKDQLKTQNYVDSNNEKFNEDLKSIKYIITLDADTDLVLNSGLELVGAMAHILNKPEIDEEKNIVVNGYGIMQPRVGINLDVSYKTLFTRIFAGSGGIDSYTNAISDLYQDNFGEGIFTGKGIYDLKVFSKIMKNAIPENKVLSHDLLEGCYLRCGLVSDIMLMDGYPTKYMSFMNRLSRWIRGDVQIIGWLKSQLNLISKYKIFDNLRRSKFEISIFEGLIFLNIVKYIFKIKIAPFVSSLIIISIFPFLLELINYLINKKEGEEKQKTYAPQISGAKAIFYRMFISLGCMPYKAFISLKAIIKTLYRLTISHSNLLEWTTSEEAEKQARTDWISYNNNMIINIIVAIITFFLMFQNTNFNYKSGKIVGNDYNFSRIDNYENIYYKTPKYYIENTLLFLIATLWLVTPTIMYYLSKEKEKKLSIDLLNDDEKKYMLDVGERTWKFFENYLNVNNNYLIPDNYQEDRKEKIINRTSSTNIGLSMMAVISACDLKYIDLAKAYSLIENIINIVLELPKWNGHLYNWYDTKNKTPLFPRYVSTVDSGNFVGYLYVLKSWLLNLIDIENIDKISNIVNKGNIDNFDNASNEKITNLEKKEDTKINKEKNKNINIEKISQLINTIDTLIENTDFSKLYDPEQKLFSIGFNIEENKLTNSYYDLLASEARQTSFIAIAKKNVTEKHWNHLSRTLTVLGKYKGLISWSGTAFEYLMPNIDIPKYQGSLLDESCKFMIMSQMKYAKEMQVPWGISEAAFNLKDLHSNYQYKAFGIPWLGLKRGLGDEIVVSAYGSVLAAPDYPKEVYQNLKLLESYGMLDKYGFYESIDFTPERLEKGKKEAIVKTYMAHHQALILLSINNLFNDNILQKRFMQNPELDAIDILLQERMPETSIITKENKEKVEKLKYVDYEDYIRDDYKKIDERLIRGNVISNEDYTIAINQKGEGFSKYKNKLINRFKKTEDYPQGIFFAIKNIKTKKIWTSNSISVENSEISFMPDKVEQRTTSGNLKTKIETIAIPDEAGEIRKLNIENIGNEDEVIEITSYFEPVLSSKEQDYAHPAFNDLFLVFNFDYKTNSLIVKRKNRDKKEEELYLCANLSTNSEKIGDLEYEIDKEKFIGRGNFGVPQMIKNSIPFSKKVGLVTEGIVALKRTIKVKANEKAIVNLVIAVGESKSKLTKTIEKYQNFENVEKSFEISKGKNEAESRYLRVKGKDIRNYQKIMSYIIFDNPAKSLILSNLSNARNKSNNKLNVAETRENKSNFVGMQESKNGFFEKNYKQSELWKYGISGDLPIMMVKIKDLNDSYVIREALKAYEFIRTKNIEMELVIVDEEKYSYDNYVREEIENSILNSQMGYLKNIKGGIFEISKNEISKEDLKLIEAVSFIIIDASKGGIQNNLKDIEDEYFEKYKNIGNDAENTAIITNEDENQDIDILQNNENLKYYNEYGAFSEDGKEYLIKVNSEKRLPTVWSHIMANEKFGTLVTENLGGYTWYKNSRLNRVSSWENQPNLDEPTEIIYLKDLDTKNAWSLGLNPMPDNKNYNVIYGFGYSKYIHQSDGIEQALEIFVPQNDSVKIQILKLKNTTLNRKKLKILYYLKPVLGEDEIKTDGFINLKFDKNNNILCAKNIYNSDFDDVIYVSNSEKITSYTGDKKSFFGLGGLANPDAIKKSSLNNENSLGKKTCIAYEIEVELDSLSEKEIVFTLGAEENILDCKNTAYKYSKIQNCRQELENVKNYWKNLTGKLQVYTPLESLNIILNGWCIYQTIQSRLLGRTGFYQSGGAYGFRDQLQDTLALKYFEPEFLKNQIIKHSKHQFTEGDVEHWWHEETGRGIRTKFSDDLLWLVFVTCEYIEFTGNYDIFGVQTPFLKGKVLDVNENERYDKFDESEENGSILEHCIRAIEKSLNFGEHDLPKIGSGDWNDGFSNVGPLGRGESVWLGFFLYDVLDRFTKILENLQEKYGDELDKKKKESSNNINNDINNNEVNKEKNEYAINNRFEYLKNTILKYKGIMLKLKKALNANAWDGRWYKRAFMDDGNTLGSMENEECRIDSISQSWSIISGAGDNDKKYISMESLENHLIDRENGIIKLLDPPFEKSKLDPGYIKAYLPGVRENGGQYTHECCC